MGGLIGWMLVVSGLLVLIVVGGFVVFVCVLDVECDLVVVVKRLQCVLVVVNMFERFVLDFEIG